MSRRGFGSDLAAKDSGRRIRVGPRVSHFGIFEQNIYCNKMPIEILLDPIFLHILHGYIGQIYGAANFSKTYQMRHPRSDPESLQNATP